jgi:hypothetical protein
MAGSTSILVGGLSVGNNFPLYSSAFEFVRFDDQGPAYRKIKVTLSGFCDGADSGIVASLFQALRSQVGKSDTTLTIIDNGTTVLSNEKVWVSAYNEPEDGEHARNRVGDYSIELYYFSDAVETSKAIVCSAGSYTFPKTPKWGRQLRENRESTFGRKISSTFIVTLSGFIYADTHDSLMGQVETMQAAMRGDSNGNITVNYGAWSQECKFVDCVVDPTVLNHVAQYTVTFEYYDGSIIKFSREVDIPRIHYNPVISEEPFCDRRLVELMNLSSQTITYTFMLQARTIAAARSLLAVEVFNTVEPGGLEMPGGVEKWNMETATVNLTIVKFYNVPIIANT